MSRACREPKARAAANHPPQGRFCARPRGLRCRGAPAPARPDAPAARRLRLVEARRDDHGDRAARSARPPTSAVDGTDALRGRRLGGRRRRGQGGGAAPERRRVAAGPDGTREDRVPRADSTAAPTRRRSRPSSALRRSSPSRRSGSTASSCSRRAAGSRRRAGRSTARRTPPLAPGKHLAVAYARTATAATAVARAFVVRSMLSVGSVEERVAVVRRRHERLLDRARADPADQVPQRARLVVRARGARAAERLLADDGAGRLVVDVEVARRVAELVLRVRRRRAILARRPRRSGRTERCGRRAASVSSHLFSS